MHKLKAVFTFLYTLFCICFPLGTFTLVFIVQSYTAYSRRTGWMVSYENVAVCIIIFIYLLYSIALTVWIHDLLKRAHKKTKRTSYIFLSVIASLSIIYWFTPNLHPNTTPVIVSTDGRFSIGPYPSKEDMVELKKQGYTTIISLLSPYILPFEPVLLKDEMSKAKQVGIKFINIPMVPWVTDNTEALNRIRALAKTPDKEKYYVHCYYGRDRGYMFLHIVDPNRTTKPAKPPQFTFTTPHLEYVSLEENDFGLVVNQQLFIGPQLTSEEFNFYIVQDNKKYLSEPVSWIINIHPPSDTPDQNFQSISSYGIKSSSISIYRFPYDPYLFLDIAQQIRKQTGSVLLYSFRTEAEKGKLNLAQDGILMSYLTNLPSLPRQLFMKSPMVNGKTTVIAPNIVLGPKPTKDELETYLYNVGVRKLMYLGSCQDASYVYDKTIATQNKLTTFCFSGNNPKILISMLAQDGPWYVYGPILNQLEQLLTNNFVHLLPIVSPPNPPKE